MTAKLLTISEKGKDRIFPLEKEIISLGREASNDIVLNDASVSRRHCVIEKRENLFYISDLQSLNGTLLNNKNAANALLADGDRIVVGDFEFRFLIKDSAQISDEVLFDKTEFVLPKNSVQIKMDEVFGAMARDLTAILQLSTKINAIRESETLQRELLKQIFEVIPADEGAILLADSENEFVEFVALNRLNESKIVNVSQTVAKQVLSEKKVILVGDLAAENALQTAESLVLSKISTLLCVPLVVFEKATGVIFLSAARANFDESHLRFLTAVAGIAAIALENAQNFSRLESENERLRSERFEQNMLGESVSMQKIFEIIKKVAPTDSTVLINGESGTGKELAAQAVHLNSKRKDKPFIAINCAALTETLLESELFGHEKGAFTGAVQQKKGKIEMANGGTLFLDEIGEMALNLQAKILRVLQEREFERVGGTRPLKADIRLIAATNRELQAEVKAGNFRQDLFYRLNVVQFKMPALRERREDVLKLAENFVEKFGLKLNRKLRGISVNAKKLLQKYDFPGNVRELENAIERAVVLGSSEWILPEDLPEDFHEIELENENAEASNYHEAVRSLKKELIKNAFQEARGSYVEAAKLLDVHPNYLHRLIRNLEIKHELEN
ncbi:MAG TPA: sigma 54-interacting transcriptional regulator [Pyrinomonadaceae bacterium]|nr:sigma 54-interacting transcriptional regulator [Pyrinomonadaceae bacterium]